MRLRSLSLFVAILLFASFARGQQPAAHALETADLEAFFDGIVPMQLERSDIAGASVLVMRDGQVLLKKGYGTADVKSGRPVDPDATLFRLASISKLFTWVSVMQLVEQGRLNLDTDVNQYLDFQIRPAFGQPITLRNLMTHTGGFEETTNDILLTDPKKAVSLRDFLIHNQPNRIFPPGKVPAYSNYGVGLASYIVQRASGQPFEQYVQQHIFTPLGMTHSTFQQPLDKRLQYTDSQGYGESTTEPPIGFELFNPVGAGGISSSAADMGRFGQALLNGGELDGHRILKPETLALMWTPQFQASPALPPQCMGFYQDWRNGLRWIGHEGDLMAFHSLFFVEPAHRLVLFVSYNSAGGGSKPRPEIIRFFSDRYFPGAPQTTFLKIAPAQLEEIEGQWEATRRADSTHLMLDNLFSQRNISVNKEGELTISSYKDLSGHVIKWKPIGKDLWQNEKEQDRFFAIRENGKIVRLAPMFPGVQIQRVRWYENSRLILPILGGAALIVVLVFITSLLRLGRRIFLRRRPRLAPQPGTIWLTWSPRLASFAWVLLLGTVAVFFIVAQGDDAMPPTPDWATGFMILNWAVSLCLLLSLFAVASGIFIWRKPDLRWITRVKFTLVALSCLFLAWFAIHWKLLGPTMRI